MLFKKDPESVDTKKLNDVISLSRSILKIAYVLLIILGIYAGIILLKELNILPFIGIILGIVSPLFLGIIIAWLFDPFVTKLQKKGLKRALGATIVYLVFIIIVVVLLYLIIPLLSSQINEFAKTLPSTFDTIKVWIDGFFNNFKGIDGFDADATKVDIFKKLEEFGSGLTQSLPEITVTIVKSFFSWLGTFVVGLIIGFYLLVSFDNVHSIMTFIPKKIREDTQKLADDANNSLRNFVRGAVIDSAVIFVVSSLLFLIAGLKAPMLFGLFCALTNVIPYAGPYIGGIPAVIVGFSQGPAVGIFTLIIIVVVQFLEGNFLQPFIMSKTTKLHPVTIMMGLLLFGYFFGIVGMILSTPIIAVLKSVIIFFNEKFDILNVIKQNKD